MHVLVDIYVYLRYTLESITKRSLYRVIGNSWNPRMEGRPRNTPLGYRVDGSQEMKSRTYPVLALALGILVAGWVEAKASEPPNVVLFLMDDMGYGDCRAYNPAGKIALPNIEALAEQGMLFTDAHSPSAVCAPTRYSVLTGNYPWRGRNENGTWLFNQPSQILPGQKTLGHLLKRAGYQTAFLGKVHLGGTVYSKTTGKPLETWKFDYTDIDFSRPIEHGPAGQGFDYSYSLPNGIQGRPYAFFENGRLVGTPDDLKIWKKGTHGDSVVKADGFGTSDWDSSQVGPKLTEKALSFIDRHLAEEREKGSRRPFFLYYCSQSCHTPHSPPAELGGHPVKGVSGISSHLDMLYEADVTVGMLIDKLRAEGELANTLFLFTSDNGGLSWGPPPEDGDGEHRSSGPLRGGKAQIWEGGHRVPLIARWGDGTSAGSKIAPGSRSDALIGIQDMYATLTELTGQTLAPGQGRDSFSFLPVLTGEKSPPFRDSLFVQANDEDEYGQQLTKMVRQGPWKLVVTRALKPKALFNLDKDLAEKTNLIHHPEHHQRVEAMHAELKRILNGKRSTAWKK